MKIQRIIASLVILVFIILLFQDTALAKDYASFKSFYIESTLKSWLIGCGLAVAGTAMVVFFPALAAPCVGTIGSAIGGMMGLSGAAATSAGLAWLGGGALAAGGFGVIGGTVLITAIFEGTMLTATQYVDEYRTNKNYAELCERVKDYPNLPPITNTDGPNEVDEVVELLKKEYSIGDLPSAERNKLAIVKALQIINRYRPEEDSFYKIGYDTVIRHEKLRVYTLKAILHFMNNDYINAYQATSSARSIYDDDGIMSVINFIYSVSGLMTDKISLQDSLEEFRAAISSETDNKMIPLLYSIYISHAGAKNVVSINFLQHISALRYTITDSKIKNIVLYQILIASLSKVWENKQRIVTIADNIDNLNIEQPEKIVAEAFENYNVFLQYAYKVMKSISTSDDFSKLLDEPSRSINNYFYEIDELKNIVNKINEKQYTSPEYTEQIRPL